MTKNTDIPKSIVEQILDEFIILLKEHKEFDKETIDRFRQLVQSGDLRKAQEVINAIKAPLEHKR